MQQPGPGPGAHRLYDTQRAATNGHADRADVRALRDFSEIVCADEVELVIFRFTSFGRLAHFRRALMGHPGIDDARIASYGEQTAFFSLRVVPGTASGALVLPGTRLINSDGRRIELCVE